MCIQKSFYLLRSQSKIKPNSQTEFGAELIPALALEMGVIAYAFPNEKSADSMVDACANGMKPQRPVR